LREDSDVALFAKLLKNEIEEDFRYIQDKIKTTVSKVLKRHLRDKYKLKSELDINSIQESMEQGFISNQTSNYILDYIYEVSDKQRIISMLQDRKKLNLKSETLYNNRGRNVTPPRYSNTKTNYTSSPAFKTKDMTPRNISKSSNKFLATDEGGSNERQEELNIKVLQEKDSNKILFQDLLY